MSCFWISLRRFSWAESLVQEESIVILSYAGTEASTTVSSDSNTYFIQILSTNSVNLIDPASMQIVSTFMDLLEQPSIVCRYLSAVYMSYFDQMVVLFESGNKFYLVAKKTSKGLRVCFEIVATGGYQRQSFYPSCLAKTVKDDFIAIGGSDSKEPRMGNAVLTIYRIGENLQSIDSINLQGENHKKLMAVSCINRLAHRDIFVAGTFGSIFIVQWNGASLSIESHYNMKHTCRFC